MADKAIDTQLAAANDPRIVEGSEGYLIEVDGEIIPNYDLTLTNFSEGDIVTGRVVRIDKDEVLVDIGYKSEGVIPVNELSIRKNVNTSEEVALDEEIDALVMTKEDADGRLILSKKRAKFEKAWKRIEGAFESGEPVTGTVIEVVKGGLILDLGVRGFLPASLVDIRRVQDLQEYVGQELNCRVIEMNRNRNNVVLSRRAVLEEERKEVRQQIIDELNVGDIVEGTISNIVDFGAFVDLDGIDGLIHISELSWTHINHPSEVLQVNQKVKVKVLDIDRDRQRISLGLKQTQEDPWQKIVARHKVGDVVEGRVTKIVAFGAFVEIYEGIEGLVHISELANRHVERPDAVLLGELGGVARGELRRERRPLARALEPEGARARPRDHVALEVGDGHDRVVEGGVHVRDAVRDVLLLLLALLGPDDLRAHLDSLDLLRADHAPPRPLARAGVRVRALPPHGQVPAVAAAAVGADLHEPLDVHRDLLAEVALDAALGVEDPGDAAHLLLGEVLDPHARLDAGLAEDLVRAGGTDPVDVGEGDLHPLLPREIDACDASHSATPASACASGSGR